jgi:hypothetical protein
MQMNLNSAVNVPMLNYHLIEGNNRKWGNNLNQEWLLASSLLRGQE